MSLMWINKLPSTLFVYIASSSPNYLGYSLLSPWRIWSWFVRWAMDPICEGWFRLCAICLVIFVVWSPHLLCVPELVLVFCLLCDFWCWVVYISKVRYKSSATMSSKQTTILVVHLGRSLEISNTAITPKLWCNFFFCGVCNFSLSTSVRPIPSTVML